MVPNNLVDEFLQRVEVGYYSNDPQKMEVIHQSLFATSPGGGAAIITSDAVKEWLKNTAAYYDLCDLSIFFVIALHPASYINVHRFTH